jgi:hypothetical protein
LKRRKELKRFAHEDLGNYKPNFSELTTSLCSELETVGWVRKY